MIFLPKGGIVLPPIKSLFVLIETVFPLFLAPET
jgi:hypothetical protein